MKPPSLWRANRDFALHARSADLGGACVIPGRRQSEHEKNRKHPSPFMNPHSPQATVPAGRSYASSILAALTLVVALTGCGKGQSPGGTKADAALMVSNKLEAIAVAGYPTTLDELNKW